MGSINVDPMVARSQATALSQAADQLTLNKTVSYSEGTTVQGNAKVKSSVNQMNSFVSVAKGALNRDVANIHSVVSSFERTDQEAKELIGQLTIPK